MNERNLNQMDVTARELQVRVEHSGYKGLACLKKIGREALKWHIAVMAADGREICNWDGPNVQGDGLVIVTIRDIENAQHEINQAIEQFAWDPMSQA